MPCGVLLSHADGADFRRSMRSNFCVFLCFLCATTFDRRTKGHNAPLPLRLCVRFFHTEFLHGLARIYRYLFEPLMGTNWHECRAEWVWSHTESTEYTESRAERYGLTQTAQTFAEACGANSVYFCAFCVQRFLREEHIFLTQRRKVSPSVCVVLRSLRAIFLTIAVR
jgi:hypothetical protein